MQTGSHNLIQTSDDGSTSYHSQNPCYKYVVVRKGFEHPEIAAKIISVMFDSARYDSNALQEFIYYYQQNVEPTARPISINVVTIMLCLYAMKRLTKRLKVRVILISLNCLKSRITMPAVHTLVIQEKII